MKLGREGNHAKMTRMILIFPFYILLYFLRTPLQNLLRRLPYALAFLLTGLFCGLITEIFAILDNLKLPPEQRVLLNPDPGKDLVLAFFWYGLFTATWLGLLRKIRFNGLSIFLIAGGFGLLTEQNGLYLFEFFKSPLHPVLSAFIMAVYSFFILAAYFLTIARFPRERKNPQAKHYLLAAAALFLFWAVYGNTIYKLIR